MPEVGKKYKPSEVSFEDKDTILVVDAIRCGRVEYTNLTTNTYGNLPIDEFDWYYAEIPQRKKNVKDADSN